MTRGEMIKKAFLRKANKYNYELSRLPKIKGLRAKWVEENAAFVGACFTFPSGVQANQGYDLTWDRGLAFWREDTRHSDRDNWTLTNIVIRKSVAASG